MFGMTRGEFVLVAVVFVIIYGASLLPKIAQKLTGDPGKEKRRGAKLGGPSR